MSQFGLARKISSQEPEPDEARENGLAWLAQAMAWLGWLLALSQGRQNTTVEQSTDCLIEDRGGKMLKKLELGFALGEVVTRGRVVVIVIAVWRGCCKMAILV
ncbi:hypothetical protein R3P38DRAFT_2786394 [Favolaschia claudopus]|uniref:Uncharacterized protein n=1 Tax=Favolaschia claudopus TaxID=2862362 RepID=A0AAW0AT38_9AGAR